MKVEWETVAPHPWGEGKGHQQEEAELFPQTMDLIHCLCTEVTTGRSDPSQELQLDCSIQHRSQIQGCFLNRDRGIIQVGKHHEVSVPASCSEQVNHRIQSRLFRALSSWVLKVSKAGDWAAFLVPYFKAWLSSQ